MVLIMLLFYFFISHVILCFNSFIYYNFQVGFGKNGTLFALEAGKVIVTCEKMNLNWDHTWIIRTYGGRIGDTIYKKYFNVIPEPQHNRFKLVEEV